MWVYGMRVSLGFREETTADESWEGREWRRLECGKTARFRGRADGDSFYENGFLTLGKLAMAIMKIMIDGDINVFDS